MKVRNKVSNSVNMVSDNQEENAFKWQERTDCSPHHCRALLDVEFTRPGTNVTPPSTAISTLL